MTCKTDVVVSQNGSQVCFRGRKMNRKYPSLYSSTFSDGLHEVGNTKSVKFDKQLCLAKIGIGIVEVSTNLTNSSPYSFECLIAFLFGAGLEIKINSARAYGSRF